MLSIYRLIARGNERQGLMQHGVSPPSSNTTYSQLGYWVHLQPLRTLSYGPISATKGTTWKEEEDKDRDEDVSILSI